MSDIFSCWCYAMQRQVQVKGRIVGKRQANLLESARSSYASMKAKIERILPKIFEKYAGPDVLALLEGAKEPTIKKFEAAIKKRPEEGAWLFYNKKGDIKPVTIDARTRFEYYIDQILNQFYLGCETPLPCLYSARAFASMSRS